ncbi:hypothetical protein [Kribbella sp. NPDC051718]|uniref:hypothetical protein n=1 Tax=Kribbella sp. NPDC051718 TaxID=3155168 RepID=UPI0034468682
MIRLKATLRQIADVLAELGDTGTLSERMARAVEVISDPALTHELLTITHHLTTTAPATADSSTAATADATSPAADASAEAWPEPDPAGDSWFAVDEPGQDDEAGRNPQPPSDPMNDDPPDASAASESGGATDTEPTDTESAGTAGPVMDGTALQGLRLKLAAIRREAYSTGIGATGYRPAATTMYLHITDRTLLDGGGVARVERFGPVFAARLEELLGHGQIVVKPVIDLEKKLNTNAYEVPRELREHLKLIHPVEQFPYGSAETTNSTDLDHIQPYDFTDTGPPGQTTITNLAPLRRYSHRVKTHGHWAYTRLNDTTLEWTTRHGLKFHVDHQGTHPVNRQ